MQLAEQDLQQITIDVCQSMLGLELTPIAFDSDSARHLVASVEIRGDRHTVVEVFAEDDLMTAIAEVMFSADCGSLSGEEIRDAFCEIANMIGGNIKGSLAEEADLSLPVIGEASDRLGDLPHGSLVTAFECCGHPLKIVVREVPPGTNNEKPVLAVECQ
jgi:CheY-specific phosphatase CheX